MTEEKKMKIEFAPGCFDNFEGTQEELDELLGEIQKMFEGKSREEIEAMSRPLSEDDFDDLPDEVKEHLLNIDFDEVSNGSKRTLQ